MDARIALAGPRATEEGRGRVTGPPEGRGGRPGGRQSHSTRQPDRRRGEGAAAERRASDLFREHGIDPASDLPRDEIPFCLPPRRDTGARSIRTAPAGPA